MHGNRTRHPAVQAIQSLLDEREISKSELARQLGWGRMQVVRRLSGDAELSVAELQEIARALEVPVSQLLPDEVAA